MNDSHGQGDALERVLEDDVLDLKQALHDRKALHARTVTSLEGLIVLVETRMMNVGPQGQPALFSHKLGLERDLLKERVAAWKDVNDLSAMLREAERASRVVRG